MKNQFDVAVLGGGPGGYEAAIRCAQYGLKTALIEMDKLGGTCLNRGCIPTKALLHGAELYQQAKEASKFGVNVGEVSYDYSKIAAHKDSVVAKLVGGVGALEKANGVEVIKGFGKLDDANTIDVNGTKVTADNIILAMGSTPSRPPIPGLDGKNVLTSDEVLAMTELPESFVIIGGGVIGMEFATVFATLGKKVTVVEMMPFVIPGIESEIRQALVRNLKKIGVDIITSAKVTSIEGGDTVKVNYELDGAAKAAEGSCCIVSVGRSPMTMNCGLEEVGIKFAERNGRPTRYIQIDDCCQTNIKNIYAIGDITPKIQLAHVASAQGMVAAANCAKKTATMNYNVVPACLYTSPEIAYVGMTEEKAKEAGYEVETGSFNVAANGKAMVMGENSGVVKIIAQKVTGKILGAQMYAPRATDMIAEVAVIMRRGGTVEDISETIHPHPTVSETVMEAAHDVEGLSINQMPKKK